MRQSRYAEAESQFKHALDISERTVTKRYRFITIKLLNNLAELYKKQTRHADAEPLYKRVLEIMENDRGKEHLNVAIALENYADLLRKMNREDEAVKLEARAQEIRAKAR
jgi:tetratricopeptide (TPR) repeat protein